MADSYQSTNEIIGSTSPDKTVLARGVLTFPVTSLSGSYYYGNADVEITKLQTTVINPIVECYQYIDYGAPSYIRELAKMPYCLFNSSGTLTTRTNVSLSYDLRTNLVLGVAIQSSISIAEATVYYVLRTTSIVESDVLQP